jgi:hypothetical protein
MGRTAVALEAVAVAAVGRQSAAFFSEEVNMFSLTRLCVCMPNQVFLHRTGDLHDGASGNRAQFRGRSDNARPGSIRPIEIRNRKETTPVGWRLQSLRGFRDRI